MKKISLAFVLSLLSISAFAGTFVFTTSNSNQDSSIATYFGELMVKTSQDSDFPGVLFSPDLNEGYTTLTYKDVSFIQVNWIGLNGTGSQKFKQIYMHHCAYTVGKNETKHINIFISGTINNVLGIDTRTAMCQLVA